MVLRLLSALSAEVIHSCAVNSRFKRLFIYLTPFIPLSLLSTLNKQPRFSYGQANSKKSGAKTTAILPTSFIRIFKDGPAVSFSGSPTVSPITAAL